MAEATFDNKLFERGLRHKAANCKKAGADILNRAGGSVVRNAIKNTPKATAAQIRADLGKNNNAVRATILRLQKAGVSVRGMSRAQFKKEVRKTVGLRARSVNYIAGAGWSKALTAFGGNGRKVSAKGKAAKGYGKRATAANLTALVVNTATASGKIGRQALQEAMDREGRFMLAYGNKEMAAALRR